jgi:uncharacterized protein YndB with AHSA1/START domain
VADIIDEINAVHRETGLRHLPSGEGRTVVLRRTYDASVEDVWDAVTNPQRISRWFLPVTGDLRLGGTYQLDGNAHGEVVRCEPPKLLAVTWVLSDNPTDADISQVEVRLSPTGAGQTVFELEHTALVDPKLWTEFGPGAVGVGWDLTLLGLGRHLRDEVVSDPDEWLRSPVAREFLTGSSNAWGDANRAAGAADTDAAAATENTTRFYAPAPE